MLIQESVDVVIPAVLNDLDDVLAVLVGRANLLAILQRVGLNEGGSDIRDPLVGAKGSGQIVDCRCAEITVRFAMMSMSAPAKRLIDCQSSPTANSLQRGFWASIALISAAPAWEMS